MRRLGVRSTARVCAKIAGGASMFGQLVNGTGINVGERNIAATREALALAKIPIVAEDAPAGLHHLVCCRNVLIYFDRETQERLFQKFRDALAPTGFLVLGKVETLLGAARSRFAAVDGRERIFRPV